MNHIYDSGLMRLQNIETNMCISEYGKITIDESR